MNEKDIKGEDVVMWVGIEQIMMVEGMDRETLDEMFGAFDETRTDARWRARTGSGIRCAHCAASAC